MSERYVATFGDEKRRVTVEKQWSDSGFVVVVWRNNHGTGGLGVIRDQDKAVAFAKHIYEQLKPEWEAEADSEAEQYKQLMAELKARPRPKPPKIPKNAPKINVLECPECQSLILPDEVSDERVYECSTCGTTGTGDDGRRCEQCNKFAAKISDTSCPECGAAMDEVEAVQAQKATNGKLIKCEK